MSLQQLLAVPWLSRHLGDRPSVFSWLSRFRVMKKYLVFSMSKMELRRLSNCKFRVSSVSSRHGMLHGKFGSFQEQA